MDRFIKLEKNDFIGRDAAAKELETGPKLRRVSLVVDAADADVMGDEPIWAKVERPGLRHGREAARLRRAALRRGRQGGARLDGRDRRVGRARHHRRRMARRRLGHVGRLSRTMSASRWRRATCRRRSPRTKATACSRSRFSATAAPPASMSRRCSIRPARRCGGRPCVKHGARSRCPPLSCRTSPPQGGRLAADGAHSATSEVGEDRRDADLPPCGGDVRQDERGAKGADSQVPSADGAPALPSAAIARSCRSSRAPRSSLRRGAREKAAALNQHVLGYGAMAEAEWAAAGIAAPDLPAMRRYRLDRIRAELKRRDYAGALLYDPVNIRYATNSTNMQLVGRAQPDPPLLRRHRRAGRAVRLFLLRASVRPFRHGRRGRPAVSWMYLYGGELTDRRVERWAAGIADLVKRTWRRQPPHRRRPPRPRRRRRARPARHLHRQWRGGDGERPPHQIARRDPVHAPRDRLLRGGDGRDAGGAEARHLRERAVGRTASRQHRARRRMDRDAAAVVGPAHQSVVPGMLVAHHRGRRPRRLRHRPDRPLRLLRRPVAHLAVRRRQAEQRAVATSTASPPTRSPTTPN